MKQVQGKVGWILLVGVGLLGMGGLVLWAKRGYPGKRPPEVSSEREAASRVPGIPGEVFTLVRGDPVPVASPPVMETLYVGTRRGLYLLSGGSGQRARQSRPGRDPVKAVAVDPGDRNRIYLGAAEGLWVSSDRGEDWDRILRVRKEILCVAIDPRDPSRLLVGHGDGIEASGDGGRSWHAATQGISEGPVAALLFHPEVPGRCYALSQGGLHRSEDGGTSWRRVWGSLGVDGSLRSQQAEESAGLEEPEESLAFEETAGETAGDLAFDRAKALLYLGNGRGIFLSRDEGEHWEPLPTLGIGRPAVYRILLDPVRPGLIYVATQDGLFFYEEARKGWSLLREGLPAGAVLAAALDADGQHLWVGTGKGLFRIPQPREAAPLQSPAGPLGSPVVSGPTIREVQQVAIRYAEVMPEKIERWRSGAFWRNFLPKFTVELDRDRDQTIASSTSGGKTSFSVGPEDESVSLDFGFTWNLADLVWDPAQTSIDVRSRLMVQLRQDLLEEVTRLYFERKRLMSEFEANPTTDPALISERNLRIEELAAQLDALTGGWFSQ